jgi:REP element-mobilizing transposase RayT
MPRVARIKNDQGIYHIMVKSITELLLFKDEADKQKFMELVKKYKTIYNFKLYAFCLMDNHGHFIIDSSGNDISKIMHCINQCYSMYYNKKYNRKGPVFADRFKSVLIQNNRQLLCTSAYIHNNPKDIHGYAEHVENYKHSSLRIYLNNSLDYLKVLDISFILNFYSIKSDIAKKKYLQFVKNRLGKEISSDMEFENEPTQYISGKNTIIPNVTASDIQKFIIAYTNQSFDLHIKHQHKNNELKSICVLLFRSLCNYDYKEICKILGNLTSASVSRLCNKGLDLILNKYTTLIDDFLIAHSL